MKKTILILIVFISAICFSFSGETKQHILNPYRGMDDSIILKKTTRAEINSKFGNDYTIQYVDNNDGGNDTNHTINRIIQRYPKLGISFIYMIFDTTVVHGITINTLFPAKTDKGIVAGKSTMAQVEAMYGKAEWSFTDSSMFKQYEGIAFVIPFNKKFPVSKTTLTAGEKKIISQIDIYHAEIDLNR